jgi:hypothetical protein
MGDLFTLFVDWVSIVTDPYHTRTSADNTSIEIILLIVCGSIPALRPLYSIYMGRNPLSAGTTQRSRATSYAKNRRSHAHQLGLGSNVALVDVAQPSQTAVTSDHNSDSDWNYTSHEKFPVGILVRKSVTVE